MKNTLDLVLAKKTFSTNQIIYPKPLQFLNQYKKLLKTITLTISHRQEPNLKLKLQAELFYLVDKKSNLYVKKENMEKFSVKKRSLQHYRWQI